MVISFLNQTIEVERAAYIVERGDEVPDWANATVHTIDRCRLQPAAGELIDRSSSGDDGGQRRHGVYHRFKLFAPYEADILERDRIRADGVTYDIDGPVQRWRSPTGTLAHTEVTLRKVDG